MKPLSARIVSRLVAAGLLLAGGALAEEPSHLQLQTPGQSVIARVTDKDISGPELQLSYAPDSMRGRAYGRAVDLRIQGDHIGGLIDNVPVNMRLEQEDDGELEAKGTFAGVTTNLEIGPEELKGRVASCAYELKAKEQRYEGSRSCGGTPEYGVFVEIPPSLSRSGAPTKMAAVALLLAQR